MPEARLVSWVAVLAVSAGLSVLLILLLKPLLMRYFLAHPNARSAHSVPTPQGAGLALMAALFSVCVAALLYGIGAPPPSLVPVFAGAVLLTVLGALDDAHALPVAWRFAGQTIAGVPTHQVSYSSRVLTCAGKGVGKVTTLKIVVVHRAAAELSPAAAWAC